MSATKMSPATQVSWNQEPPIETRALVFSAAFLAIGFVALPIAGAFHPDGPLNDHAAVFTEYAHSVGWTADHLAFFAAYAVTIAGLIVLFYALQLNVGVALQLNVGVLRLLTKLGIAAAGAALALRAVRFAIDGVVLKRAVDAWIAAPNAERRRVSRMPKLSDGSRRRH
jgi:hypothetical protein